MKKVLLILVCLLLAHTTIAYEIRYLGDVDEGYFNNLIKEAEKEYDMSQITVIVISDMGSWRECGRAFMSGKIILNSNEVCRDTIEFHTTIIHKIRHILFWKQPKIIQMSYCNEIGLDYGIKCWQFFAGKDYWLVKNIDPESLER